MAQPPRRNPTVAFEEPTPPSDGGASAFLVASPDTPEERSVPVGDRPVRIGSDDDNDLRIDDPHVSRRHAEVRRSPDGVILRDLGSKNGTFVEGIKVKEVLLPPGANITIGATAIRFVAEGERARTPRPLPPGGSKPPDFGAGGTEDGPSKFGSAVGSTPTMRQVFALLTRVAPTDLTICIGGETGTGKDVLARAIHSHSLRAKGPFVVFDCGAVAPSLIESELFGHERGAFTGAVGEHRGAFERAHGGTLFLDEVGELAIDLQPKLLRALEQRKVRRVGGTSDFDVDVRIIAATNRDLEKEVAGGRFRQDLFYRLSAAQVHIQPLRERLQDLPVLVEAILGESAAKPMKVSKDTLEALAGYDWPGNVRELKNAIAGAAALADGPILEPRHLIFFKPRKRAPTIDSLPLAGRSLESIERAAIVQTLRQCDGNKTKAARALGIAPSTLYEKIKKYGL
jgi:transcriptional regulator with AAA-type ATPase domain